MYMLYTGHSRSFAKNCFVYPVLSRRSKGISAGINLTPDRVCNFNCIYCQVDRTETAADSLSLQDREKGETPFIEIDIHRLCSELKETLDLVKTGRLFSIPPFDKVPHDLRVLSDIALSGDGEPTTSPFFFEVVEEIISVKKQCWNDAKLILITNASGLNRPWVRDALDLMYDNNGEVWAKLDGGSDAFYRMVSRTNIPLRHILHNITSTAKRHPLIIQSCFNRIYDSPPLPEETVIYANRLKEIREKGGKILYVQIYTVARPPAEDYITPLSKDELTSIAQDVQEIAGIPVEIFI